MSEPRPPAPLVAQVLAGDNEELQLLAAEGLLPLPAEQVISIQLHLARHAKSGVAQRAAAALSGLDPRLASRFLAHEADAEALRYFAEHSTHPAVLEAIIRRRDATPELLEHLAARLSPDLQEVLLLRQDVIVEHPQILDRLQENPQVSSYSSRRIAEYRQHLLPHAAAVEEVDAEEAELLASDEEVAAAIAAARGLPAEGEIDEEKTGLSESQVRSLPLGVRLRLSRGASRALRGILIRDNNTLVALSVLRNNAFSDQEIEQVARSRAVIDEVLEFIAKRREWMRKYPVVLALVQNPRTPVGIALRLVPQVAVRDLRNLGKDKNIPDAVRSTALRLYRIKQV